MSVSFAQSEREVTGERIRDKSAATKHKEMWMGGLVPLEYDVRERRLVNPPGLVGLDDAAVAFPIRDRIVAPTPDRRVIRRQTALGEQLFDIAERQPSTGDTSARHKESAPAPSAAT
jgi:hypothetical protein